MKWMRRLLLIGYLIAIIWQLAPVQVYAEEELSKPITAWPLIYLVVEQSRADVGQKGFRDLESDIQLQRAVEVLKSRQR